MFPSLLESCELNNEFSTKLLDYIRDTKKAMLSLFFWGGGVKTGIAVIRCESIDYSWRFRQV